MDPGDVKEVCVIWSDNLAVRDQLVLVVGDATGSAVLVSGETEDEVLGSVMAPRGGVPPEPVAPECMPSICGVCWVEFGVAEPALVWSASIIGWETRRSGGVCTCWSDMGVRPGRLAWSQREETGD